MEVSTTNFLAELGTQVKGDLHTENIYRQIYSTDASDYQMLPTAVLCPKSIDDVKFAVDCCAKYGIPLVSRGGGTSLSGQTVGTGLIIDYSKYLNDILRFDEELHHIEVQPGISRGKLNEFLAPFSQQIGPDPSSSAIATIGGMTANNSTGTHSIRYGMMADNVTAVESIFANGERLLLNKKTASEVKRICQSDTFAAKLYKGIIAILNEYKQDILTGYPNTWRNVAGYNLHYLLRTYQRDGSLNLASLLVGSEGTLGTLTKIQLKSVSVPTYTWLALVHFDDLQEACESVTDILKTNPSAIEFTDRYFIQLTSKNPIFGKIQSTFINGDPEAVLIVEYASDRPQELEIGLENLKTCLKTQGHDGEIVVCDTPDRVNAVWNTRKATFALLMSKRGDERPLSFADDGTVPIEELGSFIRELRTLFAEEGVEAAFVGHASAGCIHVNPILNRKEENGIEMMERLGKAIANAAIKRNGTTSGEHGEGIAKSYFNEQLYGPRLNGAFRKVKELFDPENIMNPGKIIDAPLPWDTSLMRVYPGFSTPFSPDKTFLDFTADGGFNGLVEMCNGAGFCRKDGNGVMCPSYRVTRDERHSTRGRANALREAIKGNLPDGLSDPSLYETLDLCLECKACKNECPSVVDMAKLKYEYLAQYQAKHGIPLKNRIFANIHLLNRWGRVFRPITNLLFNSPVFRKTLEMLTGIDRRRRLPILHAVNFQRWYAGHASPKETPVGEVVLWDDTYLTFNQPEIGIAAVRVLEAVGLKVHLIKNRRCCGRPMISKGLLSQAKIHAAHNINLLLPFVERGVPIVGLEPSCIAAFKDEYQDLLPGEGSKKVAKQSFFIEDFLMDLFQKQRLHLTFQEPPKPLKILFHGHCYQKALGDTLQTQRLLSLIPNATVVEIPSGCCGMAGAFGYEKGHYDISLACGEEVLFPMLREEPDTTLVAAAGVSCRHQIEDGVGKKAVHPIVLLARFLRKE